MPTRCRRSLLLQPPLGEPRARGERAVCHAATRRGVSSASAGDMHAVCSPSRPALRRGHKRASIGAMRPPRAAGWPRRRRDRGRARRWRARRQKAAAQLHRGGRRGPHRRARRLEALRAGAGDGRATAAMRWRRRGGRGRRHEAVTLRDGQVHPQRRQLEGAARRREPAAGRAGGAPGRRRRLLLLALALAVLLAVLLARVLRPCREHRGHLFGSLHRRDWPGFGSLHVVALGSDNDDRALSVRWKAPREPWGGQQRSRSRELGADWKRSLGEPEPEPGSARRRTPEPVPERCKRRELQSKPDIDLP